LSPPTGLAVN